MSGLVATRNTCFALISAIEDDFRSLISALVDIDGSGSGLLPSDVKDNALRRRAVDIRMDSVSSSVPESDLLPYIDFADIAKILESKIAVRVAAQREWLISTSRKLLELTPTRNRVCHTRPLEMDDLPRLVDFATELIRSDSPFNFQSVVGATSRLKTDPGSILTLQIPTFWTERSTIHHNLPIPEFDETGFVGRQADRMNVLRLIKSHYPVVTVVGEGGIGKTALALRCLYDLLDDPSVPYDAIVWVSLKTAALTHAGVKQVVGAITTTLGLLSEVAKQLGATPAQSNGASENYIDEISEYLNLFRIVIAIDNLETISASPLRELLLRVPSTSKILITSRIGLGEFEARYPLHGLEEKAAVALFRAHARILGVNAMLKLDDGNVRGYCKRLFYNPLLIKWFMASVSRGSEPGRLTNRDGETFAEALSFCFQNLFERLGRPERSVISCLASARKPLTSAEIHFLMPELSATDIEIALVALHNSSIVHRSKQGGEGFEYTLSESTAAFVAQNSPPSPIFFKDIQERLRSLRVILTQESILEDRYEYDPFFVRTGSGRDERICATYLRHALDHLRQHNFDEARKQVAEAKRLASSSGEVWRISGLVEEIAGDNYKAIEHYEHAVDLDPKSRIIRYTFAMFLMSDMDDLEAALSQLLVAESLDPYAAPVLTAKAMALTRTGHFEEAARIHEALLPSLSARERRWRLTGADQAADTYRRWAHREWEQKEYTQADKHARRAMNILLESAERGDVDNKLLQRTAKLLNEVFAKKELVAIYSLCEYLTVGAERIHALSGGASIPVLVEMSWALRSMDIPFNLRDRLMRLDRSPQPGAAISPATGGEFSAQAQSSTEVKRHYGVIHNLQVRFGFIECQDGSRWFFHRNFLSIGTPWESLALDVPVSFRIGQNSHGECAVDVCLVTP